jgi:NADH-quinone oxidoreductase subunit H
MSDALQHLFWILIFPGFVFTLVVGCIASWIVRKVSALVQWRVGPPILQPFYDVAKLLGKEILMPEQAQAGIFIGAPLVGLSAVTLLSTILWHAALGHPAFVGDIIVVMYLMVIPSLALILGGSASASPHGALGSSREMKLVLGYELPLVLALIVVFIKMMPGQSWSDVLSLGMIAQNTPVWSISGMLAFLAALFCVQAKLGFVPFDIAESETEIASGLIIEYSGALLALWKVMQVMMLVALPMFLVIVFLGGFGPSLVYGIAKYVLILVLIILIKNTNPRVRIDQAMKFFWFYCGVPIVVAVILAVLGNRFSIGWL